jgi:hypothetical protein
MTKTTDISHHARNGSAKQCAICHGKFGLIRYYSWRSALCSKKCRDRFKTREEGDRKWLRQFQATTNGFGIINSSFAAVDKRCHVSDFCPGRA